MADIKVVIQLQDTIEDEINSLESPTDVSNASINKTGEQFNTLSTKSAGANLKSWATGSLSLADGYVGGANTQLIEQYGYNGYVFGAVPESKQLTVTLEVVGKYIDSIIVYGDKTANQFPTKAYRDGNPNDIIYSDDPVWAIKFDQQSTSHTITFLEWNRANYNACITYVAELKNELTLDKSWIKSVESLSQSTGQPRDIYYGVVPNTGSVDILDIDGEIGDMITDGIIPTSNMPLKIIVNNAQQQVHIATDSDYSRDKILNIQNTNFLQSWDNFRIRPKVRNNTAGTLIAYFKNTMKECGFTSDYVDEMCSNVIRDGKTAQEIMSLIRIPYQYHKSETLMDFVNNICKVCQFSLVCDELDMPKFVNGNPNINYNSIVRIPIKNIFNTPEKDIIVKNKVSNIRYMQNSFVKNVKDICNRTFYLRDKDGNFNISNIDNGQIIASGSKNYLCFFVQCSDSDSEFMWTVNSSEDGITYPFNGILKGESFESMVETYIPEIEDTTKENYDFNNRQGNCCELKYYRTLTSKTFAIALALPSDYETSINQVSIVIMQQCISKIQEEKTLNDETKDIYDMEDSSFLSLQTTYNYTDDIYTYNLRQIINNYKDGVAVANITIGCMDMYDINGNKVKDWRQGQIVNVGDVIRVDKDNEGNSMWNYKNGEAMYWRVTGRNFRKVGVPMIDLELQEVRVVS